MAKKKPNTLPAVGSVIAYRLPNGLYATFRVLKARRMDGPKYVLAVCSPYISKGVPTAVTDEMKLILKLTFRGQTGKKPSIYWIASPLDAKSRVIGSVPPSKEEKLLESNNYGHWLNLQQDALTQWRWDHERDKLQADEAAEQAARREKGNRIQATADAEMTAMTLEKLAKYRFFPDWDDYPPAKAIKASRQLMKEHVAQLSTLGKTGTKSQKSAII